MRRELMQAFGQRASERQLCQWLNLPRNSGYYKPSGGKQGVKPSTHNLTRDGQVVPNEQVINTLISEVFSQEFNLYGYQFCNEELRVMGFIINPNRTYGLMHENALLLEQVKRNLSPLSFVILLSH